MIRRLSCVWTDDSTDLSDMAWPKNLSSYVPVVLKAFWLKHDQVFVWKVDDQKTKEARTLFGLNNTQPWRYWKDAEEGVKELSQIMNIEVDMAMQDGMYARLLDMEMLSLSAYSVSELFLPER